MDFLDRSLPACLFSGADYVTAQRRRRHQLDAMKPIYEAYDVLVTAGPYGPAPRLDAHSSITFWRNPSIATPFDVTGGPAISLCNGFSETGLPLALQIVGRPFDDVTILRTAHAVEAATIWRERRPTLEPGLAPDRPVPHAPPTPAVTLDTATQDLAAGMARCAGLSLNETQLAFLYEAAPEVFAMTIRLRQPLAWADEPASTFRFS